MIKQEEQWHPSMTETLTSSSMSVNTGHYHSLWNIGTMCVPANSSSSCIVQPTNC